MKPIIVDMKDMSDSTEIYDSKPNRFIVYSIYLILIILTTAVSWMALFKIDIVVKSNGIFKENNILYEITSGVAGNVKKICMENGQYIAEGDVLCIISIDGLSDKILRYQNDLESAKARLQILSVYNKSLDGDDVELDILKDNLFHDEFVNRRKLLFASLDLNKNDTEGQITLYQGNVDSLSDTIAKYNEKIEKLNAVRQCVISRHNNFDSSEGIYYSMVSSYLASYNYTSLQYDNKTNEYQNQIDEYREQIKKADAEVIKEVRAANRDETVNTDIVMNEDRMSASQIEGTSVDAATLKKQRDSLVATRDSVEKEKMQALMNLELQQITIIEQQISGYRDTILSLESSLTSAKLQLDDASVVDNEVKKSIAILTEKGKIAAEILNYEDKVKECEHYIKNYDVQNDNCVVKANASGYFYCSQGLRNGSFVQEGTAIGTIYPETEFQCYAEIYIENTDIAKIKEGQEVNFEITAYPSSEYGYFRGTVENISKDISVDQSTGNAYYIVRVKCENMTLKEKNGEDVTLMNGMACKAKIIIDEKNVLTYLLEKIDLLD